MGGHGIYQVTNGVPGDGIGNSIPSSWYVYHSEMMSKYL